ncbi:hypothetical protein PDESU_00843 [Pontiella desulfatans]|uniref:Uncharacterized protein n=1 Tax=Pontiella desulfatans TaxID=2750659 RepID=A0A6C2TXI1_PONDE|nr:hypothetical protein [Pontiella desulfatans]VGO12292.1 hypothetical protein PDESU_00843 [Pontiella desulfatans]
MKKAALILLFAFIALSSSGQFFSKEEKAARKTEKKEVVKTALPEAEQKAVYMELCAARVTAEKKAMNIFPIKIHQTPAQREQRRKKAKRAEGKLMEQYRNEIAKKHNVTEQLLSEILTTGDEQQWPTQAAGE